MSNLGFEVLVARKVEAAYAVQGVADVRSQLDHRRFKFRRVELAKSEAHR